MANVSLKHINKIYPNNVQAVFDFNLDIKDKEFIVFVGPSGCGKSTTLRMIAGLEDITNGELYIDGRYSNTLAPQSRDIALVFQNYALYPHMTVYDNMAFGLKNRRVPQPIMIEGEKSEEDIKIETEEIKKIEADKNLSSEEKVAKVKKISGPKMVQKLGIDKHTLRRVLRDLNKVNRKIKKNPDDENLIKEQAELEKWYRYFANTEVPLYKIGKIQNEEIHDRIMEASRILDITKYLKRKPKALSGGQMQRVALGRAIVRHAKVFLMDEPLSNLDAKLRVQMRSEIIKLHKRIGATTIYVTHDQTEAMTMADRIVCMKAGYIQQIGKPEEIYNRPSNKFVATFLGAPAMNIVNAHLHKGVITVQKDMKFDLSAEELEAFKSTFVAQRKNYEEKLKICEDNLATFHEKHHRLSKKLKIDLSLLEDAVNNNKTAVTKYDELINKMEGEILIGFRPEHVSISLNKKEGYHKAIMDVTEMMGDSTLIHAIVNDTPVSLKVAKEYNSEVKELSDIYFTFKRKDLYLFDAISELAIYAAQPTKSAKQSLKKKTNK